MGRGSKINLSTEWCSVDAGLADQGLMERGGGLVSKTMVFQTKQRGESVWKRAR